MNVVMENDFHINDVACYLNGFINGFLNGFIIHDLEETFHDIRIERPDDFAHFIALKFNQVKVDIETGMNMCNFIENKIF